MKRIPGAIFILLAIGLIATRAPGAAPISPADQAYIQRFLKAHPRIENPPALAEYATVQRYDQLYMGDYLDQSISKIRDDGGRLAWSISYQMQSLNQMFLNTRDFKYLLANLRLGRKILAVRDDKVGTKTWNGQSLAAWSSPGYSKRGRAVFLVHTGMIVYPLLHSIWLARQDKNCPAELRTDLDQLLSPLLESIHVHDREWRPGPGSDKGYYIGLDEEPTMDNRPQPVNRLSAIGRALWVAWQLTGDTSYRDKALAMGRYIHSRLPIAKDGSYYWAYWLSTAPATQPVSRTQIKGEDASHAGLSITFPIQLAEAGQVFTPQDMKRFGTMFENGISRLRGGIMLADVTGNPASSPARIGSPANYLRLRPWCPQIADRIIPFYLQYKPTPTPLELSLLIPLTK
jgi:hypothetical protein